MGRPTLVRVTIFLATVVAAWGILSLGTSASEPELTVGEPALRRYVVEEPATVVDVAATQELEDQARESVEPIRESDPEIESSVITTINELFSDVQALVIGEEPSSPTTTVPELPTTTTQPSEEATTTTVAEDREPTVITGRVFLDVDADGFFNPDAESTRPDEGLARITVEVRTHDGTSQVRTGADGRWTATIESDAAVISVDESDPAIPQGWAPGTENLAQLVECEIGQECEADDIGFAPNLRPLDEVESALTANYALPEQTISYLAATASEDVIRAAVDEPLHLPTVLQASLDRVLQEFGRTVEPDGLPEAKARVRGNPPLVFHTDTGQDVPGGEAAGEIVATYLQANYRINQDRTEEERRARAEAVPDVTVEYVEEQVIVDQGQRLTQLDIDAINETSSVRTRVQAQGGLLAVVTVLVALLSLYLARFRPDFWARPRMVALLGILVVLAAASVRGTSMIAESTSWYVLPAVGFGFIAAVLFDSRIGVLISLAVGVLTAVGSMQAGITVYAVLATMAPIPFVSSVSSRGAFRNAVVLSSLTAAVIAGAISWFFDVGPNDELLEVIGVSVAWSFGVSIVASLVGLAALQFFESSFDITTTLSLLDLTDRNHQALQILQEEAFGTFNHSLMVGTLADAAARAIGANPLLARAMAYYHDLGKTQNPTFFIENQFGAANPHDELDPKESAQIIRDHVSAGVALAKQFRIPTDVTQGIVSHHGDGVMRYFYEKARELHGDDVDIDDFRHIGHKPRMAETAILMMADALEAACRAVFQTEEPSADAIEKVVDRIMDEKLEDGQLSEAPLTLAELTKIRKAFLESLIGHYHQRIAYPNFPGS